MKTKAVVELITDAVTDAVREVLPRLIAEAVDKRVADGIGPELDRLQRAQVDAGARLQESIDGQACDFANALTGLRTVVDGATRDVAERLTVTVAEQVARAVSGVPSLPGPCGPPGPPGRDATFTPPVHWQPETNFTRGAIVMHRNGLWFANQDTAVAPGSGVDGYSLMFDGHELQGVEYDERGYRVEVYRYASGKLRRVVTGERPFKYCGVFDPETSYFLNDCVTANGCVWLHKSGESLGLRPGTNEARDAWQLAVKSGRDGAAGPAGPPGPQGPQGTPGERGPPGESVTRTRTGKANGAQV